MEEHAQQADGLDLYRQPIPPGATYKWQVDVFFRLQDIRAAVEKLAVTLMVCTKVDEPNVWLAHGAMAQAAADQIAADLKQAADLLVQTNERIRTESEMAFVVQLRPWLAAHPEFGQPPAASHAEPGEPQ